MNKLLYISNLIIITLVLVGCPKHLPEWNGKLYHSRPDLVGVRRFIPDEGIDEFIHCGSEDFKHHYCVSEKDLLDLIDILHSCKEWR